MLELVLFLFILCVVFGFFKEPPGAGLGKKSLHILAIVCVQFKKK